MASPHRLVDTNLVYDSKKHRVMNLELTPHEIEVVTSESQIPSDSQQQPLIGAQYAKIAFDEWLAGSGTAGTPPPNDALLKASGLKYSNVVSTSDTYLWTEDFPADVTAITIASHAGNSYKQSCENSVGNSSWVFEAGQPAIVRYEGVGTYAEPTETIDASALRTEAKAPVCINSTATLAGATLVMDRISINLNNVDNSPYKDMAATLGVQNPILLSSTPTFEALFVVPTLATKNFMSVFTTGTKAALQIILGSVAGNIITIDVDGFITGVENSEKDGVLAHLVSLQMSKIAADQQLQLVFT